MHRCRDGPEPQPPPPQMQSTKILANRGRARARKRAGGGGASMLLACLLAATAVNPPPVAHGELIRGSGAAGTPFGTGTGSFSGSVGCCHRRGLADYSTRGCFVLCVTPSSATAVEASGGDSSRRRGRGGSGGLTATSSVRRTRAGAVASQPLLAGAFLNRGSLEQRVAAAGGDGCPALGLSRGGGGGDADVDVAAGTGTGGGRGLECAAKDGRARSRFRQILNKLRGGAPPPVAVAAGSEMMYDTNQDQVCVV